MEKKIYKLKELVGKTFVAKYDKCYEKSGKYGNTYTLGVTVDGEDGFLNLTEKEHEFYFKNKVKKGTEYEVYENKRGYPAIKAKGSGSNSTSTSSNNYSHEKKMSKTFKKKILENAINDLIEELRKELAATKRFTGREIDELVNSIEFKINLN